MLSTPDILANRLIYAGCCGMCIGIGEQVTNVGELLRSDHMTGIGIRNKGYGFIDAGPADQTYVVTADCADLARNHCAATMLTNWVINCCGDDSAEYDRRALFQAVHAFVGNGPILWLERRANRYLRSRHIPYVCTQIGRHLVEPRPDRLVQIVVRELDAGRPCGLMVAESLISWHWVLAVSAEQGPDGDVAIRIIDGWHARRIFRYIPDQGSRLLGIAIFQRPE